MTRKLMIFVLLIPLVLSGLVVAQDEETVVEFPVLTGEYQVGRATYHMIDEGREEIFTPGDDDVRELMVTFYYPAEPGADDDPAPYMADELKEAMSASQYMPRLPWDMIVSHAYSDVPVLEDEIEYPVLLFSPGITMNPVFYTAMVEEVTSHGYIVVTLAHPYSIDPVVFPDGRVVRLNNLGGTRLFPCIPLLTGPRCQGIFDEIGDVWVKDVFFVLDQLVLLNQDDPLLGGHMDLARVGMFGHSFGGATSAEAAYRDQRIQAAINIDAPNFSGAGNNGFTQPFMMAFSDYIFQGYPPDEDPLTQLLITQTETICQETEAGYTFRLLKSMHDTYSDVPLLMPLSTRSHWRFEGLEHIEAQRAHEVITTYIVAFFDKHVKDEDVALLDGPSADYPEVVFEVYGG